MLNLSIMKKYMLLFVISLFSSIISFSRTFEVKDVGFSFSPSTITLNAGDTVNFVLGSIHDALEVSEASWNAEVAIPLLGGFSTPFGGGKVKLTDVGTHYFVCENHIGFGMKGKIIVDPVQGIGTSFYYPDVNLNVFPNPSNGNFTIDYSLNERSRVEISIIDLAGRINDIILAEEQEPAIYRLNRNIYARGMYIVRFTTDYYTRDTKILIQQ
jgi:plastocyanin